ncbi:A/G-specific adenine glycosylase [Georgenia sp. Z1344]|uniref:A/G-specific adenine glycosylase n=1 Tax=Georgenia sp. Z1344 TaxID=3416706 RepID=UPI003CEC501A
MPEYREIHDAVAGFWADHARDLPWRRTGTTPWGVLVSETMSQQTPVARVAPAWEAWMARWPVPADLAAAPGADVLRAWDRLGYPRRALRLKECAAAVVRDHDGEVPGDEADLLALPGVGPYTAAAVVAFAHRRRAVVLDTNVRRVLARVLGGEAAPPPGAPAKAEQARAADLLPAGDEASAAWNAGVMELGALVCTARAPRCDDCPLAGRCTWRAAGYPADTHAARRRSQPWEGTDRQARGRVMAALRAAEPGATHTWAELVEAAMGRAGSGAAGSRGAGDAEQAARVVTSLLADGLVVERGTGLGLP